MSRKKWYNQEVLLYDLAAGRLSLRQIARRHGLSAQFVCRIRQGRGRPDLGPRIDSLRRAILDEGFTRVGPVLKALLARHIQVGLKGRGENAHLCRRYLLDRFLPPERSACNGIETGQQRNAPSGRAPGADDDGDAGR